MRTLPHWREKGASAKERPERAKNAAARKTRRGLQQRAPHEARPGAESRAFALGRRKRVSRRLEAVHGVGIVGTW